MGMCRETGVGRIRDCIYPPFLWAAGTPSCVTASSLSLLFLLGNLFYLAPAKLGPINTPLLLQNVPLLFCHFPCILDLSVSTCQWLSKEWPLEPRQYDDLPFSLHAVFFFFLCIYLALLAFVSHGS